MTDTELLEAILGELEGLSLQMLYLDGLISDMLDAINSGVQVARWLFPWGLICSMIYIWRYVWRRLDHVD